MKRATTATRLAMTVAAIPHRDGSVDEHHDAPRSGRYR